MKIRKIVKRTYNRTKKIVFDYIPNTLFLIFKFPFLKKKFKKIGLKRIKVFSFKSWHLGYKYFKGIYLNNEVFIKYNDDKNVILNEANNIKFLSDNSKELEKRIPKLYEIKVLSKSAYIVEEFLKCKSIKELHETKKIKDLKNIYEQFIMIVKEFQKIGFMHLDINPNNVYIDENDMVKIIDFGFSIIKKDMKEVVPFKKKQKKIFVIKNLNKYSRLSVGYIDDAFSFLKLSTTIDTNFISDYYNYWKIFNELSNILYLDYKEQKI